MGRPSDVDRELCFAPYLGIYGDAPDDLTDHNDNDRSIADADEDEDDDAFSDVVTFWPRRSFEVDGIVYDPTRAIESGGDRAMFELVVDCQHRKVDE